MSAAAKATKPKAAKQGPRVIKPRPTPAPKPETPAQEYKRKTAEAMRSHLEDEFWHQIHALNLPRPIPQFNFHPDRQYRADFCFFDARLLVELDGGTRGRLNPKTGQWEQKPGGHTTALGYHRDRVRDAEAALAGWLVLRLDADMVTSGEGIGYVARILAKRRAA